MTKKKKKPVKPSSEGARRFKQFVKSEEFAKVRGIFYILLALFLTLSMLSYIVGGPSENWCGAVGGWFARLLVAHTFGLAALGFGFLLFIYALRLLHREVLPWRRTLLCTCFWMLWLSVTLGYFSLMTHHNVRLEQLSGIVGLQVAEVLNRGLKIGFPVLWFFLAVAFLILVHHVKLPRLSLRSKADEEEAPRPGLLQRWKARRAQKVDEIEEPDAEEKQPKRASAVPVLPVVSEPVVPDAPASTAQVTFKVNGEMDEATAEEPTDEPSTESGHGSETAETGEEVAFDIDREFERINRRAQGAAESPSDPTFNIVETDVSQADGDESNPGEPQEAESDETEAEAPNLDEPYDPRRDLRDFVMPDTTLLEDWEQRNVKVTKDELVANKDNIVRTLHNYGIEITEITASPGPTVTLYEIKPAPGVRISKIKSLEDDIALSLAALGIRIIAPIPGKGSVGIEVPNANPQIVSMKTMLTSDAFVNNTKYELPIAFGRTISNEPFVTDLAKMPHLLMAGATGTGKSVGLNAVIASLLYKKHPAELKFVMVDPKKVELSLYSKIERHYLAKLPDSEEAIITDVKKVVRTLNSLCIEMDQRYDLLKQAQVRKITEYNDKFIKRRLNPNNGHRYLPYIVVVIDEFADLIMTAGKEIETPICRLAQLARAVGIHLIIATQRPTTNIITGTIKANFPARIAFRVTSVIDSRTILDCGGANQLIGRGDMLISLSGSDLVRCQCALIETEEIERLADFIGQQRGYADGQGFQLPEYLDENEEPNKDFDPKQKDEFFNDAARLVVQSQFGSTSLLQRKLQLGYNRAGRIIDQLEAAGIVGPYNGSKAREVLIHDEVELEELLRAL